MRKYRGDIPKNDASDMTDRLYNLIQHGDPKQTHFIVPFIEGDVTITITRDHGLPESPSYFLHKVVDVIKSYSYVEWGDEVDEPR